MATINANPIAVAVGNPVAAPAGGPPGTPLGGAARVDFQSLLSFLLGTNLATAAANPAPAVNGAPSPLVIGAAAAATAQSTNVQTAATTAVATEIGAAAAKAATIRQAPVNAALTPTAQNTQQQTTAPARAQTGQQATVAVGTLINGQNQANLPAEPAATPPPAPGATAQNQTNGPNVPNNTANANPALVPVPILPSLIVPVSVSTDRQTVLPGQESVQEVAMSDAALAAGRQEVAPTSNAFQQFTGSLPTFPGGAPASKGTPFASALAVASGQAETPSPSTLATATEAPAAANPVPQTTTSAAVATAAATAAPPTAGGRANLDAIPAAPPPALPVVVPAASNASFAGNPQIGLSGGGPSGSAFPSVPSVAATGEFILIRSGQPAPTAASGDSPAASTLKLGDAAARSGIGGDANSAMGDSDGANSPVLAAMTAPSGLAATPNYVAAGAHSAPPISAQVADGIVSNAYLTSHGRQSEFQIRLDPPELGPIHIRLTSTPDGVSAHLSVADPGTRQLIENQMPDLRQRLQDSGLTLGNFNVSTGAGSGGGFQQQDSQAAPRGTGESIPAVPSGAVPRTQTRSIHLGTLDVTA